MLQKLFGGPKRPDAAVSSKASERNVDAIQRLQETEELLEKRKEVVEKKINAELEKAKLCLKQGNKPGAQAALKRKALLQNQLENLENNAMRIQEQKQVLENAQLTVQTVAAMQQAAQAHKATMADFKLEKVDKVMDDIQEAAEQANEIQEAMAMPLGPAANFDEDALADELAEIEAQQLDAELLQPAPVPSGVPSDILNLPAVPTTKPGKKTTAEELAELESEMMAT